MLRWMNFQNMQFQKHASYDIVKYITVAVALLLMQIIRNCIAVGTKKNEK